MDAQFWTAVLPSTMSALALIVVAVIETMESKSRKRNEARAARRAEESRLSMELMSAACKLSTVTAKAVTGHKTNGDVEEALEMSKEAQEQYERFKTRLAADQVAKI